MSMKVNDRKSLCYKFALTTDILYLKLVKFLVLLFFLTETTVCRKTIDLLTVLQSVFECFPFRSE